MCEYRGAHNNLIPCPEEEEYNGKCIIHAKVDAPYHYEEGHTLVKHDYDEYMRQYTELMRLKIEKIHTKIEKGNFCFEGLIFGYPYMDEPGSLKSSKLEYGVLIIDNEDIDNDVVFANCEIGKLVFHGCRINGAMRFEESWIRELVLENIEIRNLDYNNSAAEAKGYFRYQGERGNNVSLNFIRDDCGSINISCCTIEGDVVYHRSYAAVGYPPADVKFNKVSIENYFHIDGDLGGSFRFDECKFGKGMVFNDSTVIGLCNIHKSFIGHEGYRLPMKNYIFEVDEKSEVSFNKTKFSDPRQQEELCRRVRRLYEEQGRREEADYHFYREMEAKRRQKKKLIRYFELPFQYIFRYGTQWKFILALYLGVVIVAALIFWIFHGIDGAKSFFNCLYFTFITITTLGYGDMLPASGWFKLLAIFLAVFGTFIWAAFIAIFARKYMR